VIYAGASAWSAQEIYGIIILVAQKYRNSAVTTTTTHHHDEDGRSIRAKLTSALESDCKLGLVGQFDLGVKIPISWACGSLATQADSSMEVRFSRTDAAALA
jgi:hypothetical protein